jgi:hypothetical protein
VCNSDWWIWLVRNYLKFNIYYFLNEICLKNRQNTALLKKIMKTCKFIDFGGKLLKDGASF